MTYLIDDVWCIVKEFMLDWRVGWNKNMKLPLEDVKYRLPTILVGERYDMVSKLYHTTFKMGNGLELRVSNTYNISENCWC